MKKDKDIKRFIEKGGSSAKEEKKSTNICLRVPMDMLCKIDGIVKEQGVMTRTTWILQTLQERLMKINLEE